MVVVVVAEAAVVVVAAVAHPALVRLRAQQRLRPLREAHHQQLRPRLKVEQPPAQRRQQATRVGAEVVAVVVVDAALQPRKVRSLQRLVCSSWHWTANRL